MHPVIQHILERKNKQVPVNDGRKIALLLFGGVMTGIRGCAAAAALQELGLAGAFDAIYTGSAGFLNASCFLAGDSKVGTSVYYDDLSGRKFLNPFRIWNVANIDYLMDIMKTGKTGDPARLWVSHTQLYARFTNIRKNRAKYFEVHSFPGEKYFEIAKAAVSIPYLQPGAIKLRRAYCKDGDVTDKDSLEELNYILASGATDILIIYNRPEQKIINMPLRELLNFEHPNRIYEIAPNLEWKLSRFETNSEKLKIAATQMGQKVMDEFGGGEFRLI